MVQILGGGQTFGEQIGAGIGRAGEMFAQMGMEKYKQKKESERFKEMFGKKEKKERQEGEEKKEDQENAQEDESAYENLTPEQKAYAAEKFPHAARQMQEEEKSREKKKQFAHTSTEKYSAKLMEGAEQADEIKFATNVMRNAIRSGKTGATAQNLAYAYLNDIKSPLAGIFQSKEGGQFNVGMKTLAGGFKQLMGQKPTEREFFWYENILPGLLKNASTNEAILDYFDVLADMKLKSREAYDRIISENKGYRPIDIDKKIRDEMKPYFNQIINEGYALAGEFEAPIGKEKAQTGVVYTEKPTASRANQGKYLIDHETGQKYFSDGKEWIPIND